MNSEPSTGKFIRTLHTHVIQCGNEKNIVLRLQDNGTVDVTIELSENECFGLEISTGLFILSMASFLHLLEENG